MLNTCLDYLHFAGPYQFNKYSKQVEEACRKQSGNVRQQRTSWLRIMMKTACVQQTSEDLTLRGDMFGQRIVSQ